jgi:transcriptional regulator with XRE-family HTH domain
MSYDVKKIGAFIKLLRKEKGLSVPQLARHGKRNQICHKDHLKRIEAGIGTQGPTSQVFHALLEGLGITPDVFYARLRNNDYNIVQFNNDMFEVKRLVESWSYTTADAKLTELKSKPYCDMNDVYISQSIIIQDSIIRMRLYNDPVSARKMLYDALELTAPSSIFTKFDEDEEHDDRYLLNYNEIESKSLDPIEYHILLLLANVTSLLQHDDIAIKVLKSIASSLEKDDMDYNLCKERLPIAYFNLSNFLLKNDRLLEALDVSQKGINACQQFHEPKQLGKLYANLGYAQQLTGQSSKAIESLKNAYKVLNFCGFDSTAETVAKEAKKHFNFNIKN